MIQNPRVKKLALSIVLIAGLPFAVHDSASGGTDGMKDHYDHDMHILTHAAKTGEVTASITTDPADITTGKSVTILITLKDPAGKPLQGLTVHHDRLLHVIIAGSDFTEFLHIHPEDFGPITPEMKKTARFPVKVTFPKAGRYIVGVDFMAGNRNYSRHSTITVAGGPELGPLKTDLTREKRFGDLAVTLSSSPEKITAGKETVLHYRFTSEGKPVTDLEPYLSAPMHLAIISADLTQFIHTHGEIPGMQGMSHDAGHMMHMEVPKMFGPEVDVHVVFPTKGIYQVFGQVGHQGKVIATGFMVQVE
ncbi:MAG: hypothetical protein M0024_11900 [Nitrospiraceae bacterium]|nr:hypothetical protein [Nitrospiraceae bacterium]